MGLTYTDHADRALRAAALVLTMPAPTGVELDTVGRLHDDLTTTLAEATRFIWTSALGEPRHERERAAIPAARELLTQLESYPRVGVPAAEPQSPSQRWSGRPSELTADLSAVQLWKVLAAETFLARSCLDQLPPRLTTPIRATVLTQVALTAEALATATTDLAVAAGGPALDAVHRRARDLSRAAVALQQQIAAVGAALEGAGVPPVPAARQRREVLLVRDASEVAPALANLARLTATGKPTTPELFAMTTMLGAMADSLATAMDAASKSNRVRDPNALTPAVFTLGAYRGELASLVRAHRPKLASLGPGNPAALAQARELRTAGVPHIQALIQDPDRPALALRALQGAAAGLAPATAAVQAGFAALDRRGEMLTYSWAPGPGFHWRAATDRDALPLLAALGSATRTAAALRPARRDIADAEPAAAAASVGRDSHVVNLAEALERRRAALGAAAGPQRGPAARCAATASLSPSTALDRTVGPRTEPL
jgi:hypothetical protein